VENYPLFPIHTAADPRRAGQRNLCYQDTLALLAIFAVTCRAGVLTLLIFRSIHNIKVRSGALKLRGEHKRCRITTPKARFTTCATALWLAQDTPRRGGAGRALAQ